MKQGLSAPTAPVGCGVGASRDPADAGHAGAHQWAGHEARGEGAAVPPGLRHALHPPVIPSGIAL